MRVLLLFLFLAGCAGSTDEPRVDAPPDDRTATEPTATDSLQAVAPFESEDDYRQQRGAIADALDAAIAPATASDVSACRVVATSEQACGGPTTFAVYSAESPSAREVETLATRLVALDEKANAQFRWASTCMAYRSPTPVLRDGRCVAADG